MHKILILFLNAFFILSCRQDANVGIFSNINSDTVFLNSSNWVFVSKGFGGNGKVNLNLNTLSISGKFKIRDSIIYIKDSENRNFSKFLDFHKIYCNEYNSLYGNTMTLLTYRFINSEDDTFFCHLLKMPFSINDLSSIKDSFLIFSSIRKGIIGISDYSRNSDTIHILNYIGETKYFKDSVLFLAPCFLPSQASE